MEACCVYLTAWMCMGWECFSSSLERGEGRRGGVWRRLIWLCPRWAECCWELCTWPLFRRSAVSACVDCTLSTEEFISFTSCSRSTSSSVEAAGLWEEKTGRSKKEVTDSTWYSCTPPLYKLNSSIKKLAKISCKSDSKSFCQATVFNKELNLLPAVGNESTECR